MKFKKTLILLIIFLVLLTLVYFLEIKHKGETDTEDKFVYFPSENIQKIVFKKQDHSMIFIKQESGDWFILEPIEAKADSYEINRLVESFSDLKSERTVEEVPSNLEKYGIPQREISLHIKDIKLPVKILIGIENPLDKTFFAKRDDETRVVLIPSFLKDILEKDVFDFRQKDIFKFETEEVKKVKLRAKKIQWECTKKDEDWLLKKPVKALAEKTKIENLLHSLSNIKAKEFISEDKQRQQIKKYALLEAEYEVFLYMPATNKEVKFSLSKKDDKTYATTSISSKIIEVDNSMLSNLEKDAEEMRDKKVAHFYTWDVDRLYIKRKNMELGFVKSEDKWNFESKTLKEAEKEKIENFLRKIENLEAVGFIDPPLNLKDYGLHNPQAEIKIGIKEDEDEIKEITIIVGSEDEQTKEVVLKNARLDYLFKTNSEFLKEFPDKEDSWEKHE